MTDIKKSDQKIRGAIIRLLGSHRGQVALQELKTFLNKNQTGLDMMGADAVVCLTEQFFLHHRRGFLDKF